MRNTEYAIRKQEEEEIMPTLLDKDIFGEIEYKIYT